MEILILPVLGIGVGTALLWLRGAVLPRRALRRAEAGRPVRMRGRLLPEQAPGSRPLTRAPRRRGPRPEQASIEVVGGDLHLVTPQRHWVLPARTLRDAEGRTWVDDHESTEQWSVRLVTSNGVRATLTLASAWRPVLTALTSQASSAGHVGVREVPRLRPLIPRWAVWVTALTAPALLAWLALLLRTTERTSPVLGYGADGYGCWVQWVEAGQSYRGAPDCDPAPAVGESLTYLTTPWPVPGNAWDTELPWVLTALLGLVLAAGVVRALIGLSRGRRRRTEEVPVVVVDTRPPDFARTSPTGVDRGQIESRANVEPGLTELLDRASAHFGWADLPEDHPGEAAGSSWIDLRRAWTGAPRWPIFVVVAALLFGWSEDLSPTSRSWPAGVAAGLALGWLLWRLASVLLVLRRTWREPFTSEWSFRSMQDATGTWVLLLLLGSTPRWSVLLPGRPPLQGSCLVRGDLRAGGSIHVRIDADLWLPDSAVARCDEEMLAALREDLHYQLTGAPR